MYANLYGWTNGTGVWILEGSEEIHKKLQEESKEGVSWIEALKAAGAKYYEHCEFSSFPLANHDTNRFCS